MTEELPTLQGNTGGLATAVVDGAPGATRTQA